ncbi:gp10 family phage protein [Staphylococcus aureus]|nr:gp10 family phage protein [Staphylococcus aureus]
MGARIESNNIEQGLKNAVLKMNLNSNVIVKAGAMSLVPLLKSNTPFANNRIWNNVPKTTIVYNKNRKAREKQSFKNNA